MPEIILAIDEDTREGAEPLPCGIVMGRAETLSALRAAGFSSADGYRQNRLARIPDDAPGWDNRCGRGWTYIHSRTRADRKVQPHIGLTEAAQRVETIAGDIRTLKALCREKQNTDLQDIIGRESIDSTRATNGKTRKDVMMFSWLKPWIRLVTLGLAAAKAAPTQANIDAYKPNYDILVAMLETPGMAGFYDDHDWDVWAPMIDGAAAWEYDASNNGKTGDVQAVAYPTGLNVENWKAYPAVKSL